MSETIKYFPRAYGITTQAEIDALYDDWAASYDKEVGENGYASPRRTAEALAQFLPKQASILDFGCGTGLSGKALRSVGFTNISGSELNASMIEFATRSDAYVNVFQTSLSDPFPFENGTYQAMTAVGVISSGAAPASLLAVALGKLASGGLIAFSFNDHAISEPEYPLAVEEAINTGKAKQLFCEYGDHLPAKNVGSNIYVLEKL